MEREDAFVAVLVWIILKKYVPTILSRSGQMGHVSVFQRFELDLLSLARLNLVWLFVVGQSLSQNEMKAMVWR